LGHLAGIALALLRTGAVVYTLWTVWRAPLRALGHLYNCGLVIHHGRLLGVVPKVFLPNYREFYERRHFTSGEGVRGGTIGVAGLRAPFGIDLMFEATGAVGPAGFTFHVEICEDLWVPQPPSTLAAAAGAELLLNLSASNIVIGKAQMRRLLCASQSARCIAAYAYSAAGAGESTTDLAWDGQAGIFEIGEALAEAGKPVVALAQSVKASREVLREEAGFADADTVARFLKDEKMQLSAKGGVILVDEASHHPLDKFLTIM